VRGVSRLGIILAVRFWTHYWTHETTTFDQVLVESGEIPSALDHTAGNSFRKRGVRPGDGVYVVSYHHGSIRLVGRLVVETIVDQRAAKRALSYEPWDADDHLLADRGELRDRYFDLWLTDAQVRQLEFVGRGGKVVRAKFNRRGDPDQQTLRSVREVTDRTASLFEELLDARARP
jgi:hypothetical protein